MLTQRLLRKAKEKYLHNLLIFLLVIFNILLIIDNLNLRGRLESIAKDEDRESLSGKTLPPLMFPEIHGAKLTPYNYGAIFTLVIIFSPVDCLPCLKEAKYWKKINDEFDADLIKVIGVVYNTNRAEILRFANTLSLDFPIYIDQKSDLIKNLGISNTPLKLLVDNKSTIIRAETTYSDEDSHLRWYKKTRNYFNGSLKVTLK